MMKYCSGIPKKVIQKGNNIWKNFFEKILGPTEKAFQTTSPAYNCLKKSMPKTMMEPKITLPLAKG